MGTQVPLGRNPHILWCFHARTTTYGILDPVTVELLGTVAFLLVTSAGVGGSLWFSIFAARLASRSAPDELVRNVGALRVEVATLRGEMEEHRARLISWRSEVEAVLESVENVLESVERKRRSTAASASKLKPPEEQPTDYTDRYQLEQLARNKGLI